MDSTHLSSEEIQGYLSKIRKEAIFMLRADKMSDDGMPGCYFGGKPTLPDEIEWPLYSCPEPKRDIPLHFIFQINLKYLPRSVEGPRFPADGTAFVFVEPIFAPVDPNAPAQLLNGEGAKLIYVPKDVSQCPPREAPALPDFDEKGENGWSLLDDIEIADYLIMRDKFGVRCASGLDKWPMKFLSGSSYPAPSILENIGYDFDTSILKSPQFAEAFDEAQKFNIDEAISCDAPTRTFNRNGWSGWDNWTPHSAFGADGTYNFCSREHVDRTFRSKNLPALTSDHIVLFTLNGLDPEIGYYYFQQYQISFWIHKDDLANGDFSKVQVWEVR